jgi:uncharacterized membrane-anchored protein
MNKNNIKPSVRAKRERKKFCILTGISFFIFAIILITIVINIIQHEPFHTGQIIPTIIIGIFIGTFSGLLMYPLSYIGVSTFISGEREARLEEEDEKWEKNHAPIKYRKEQKN